MAGTGRLTDTELLGLISKTTQGSTNQILQYNQENPARENENRSEGENFGKAVEQSSVDDIPVSQQPECVLPSFQAVTQSDVAFPVQIVTESDSDIVSSLQTVTQCVSSLDETVSQPTVTPSVKAVTQSDFKHVTSVVLQSQTTSEPGSLSGTSSDKLGSPINVKSPTYKLDAELVSMLSQEQIINLVHECKTELEITKKKLERSERQLTKANDYNDVLRNMVEKLSSEIHRMKNGKTCSVYVQVDKDDFLDYTTGRSSMPKWNTEGDLNSEQMDVGQSCGVAETAESSSVQQPGAEMDNISIADSIKQAAEAVVQQQQSDMLVERGYVYDEHSGLYYHPASGYYYDQHKSLFYDPKSGIYYYYDYDTGEYMFHSQIDLQSQNQSTDQSTVKKDDLSSRKSSDTKKSSRTPKKNRSSKRYSLEDKVFKNRKERRQAEKEYRLKQRQERSERYEQRHGKESGRKRRRNDDAYSSDNDQNRGHRSTRSHGRGHKTARSNERDKSRRKRSRSNSRRYHQRRKHSEVSESHSDVQIIEENTTELSKVKTKFQKEKGKSKRSSVNLSRSKRGEHAINVEDDELDTETHSVPESSVVDTDIAIKDDSGACVLIDSAEDYQIESENEVMIIDSGGENGDDIIEAKGVDKNFDVKNISDEIRVQMKKVNKENSEDELGSHRRSKSKKYKHNHKRDSEETNEIKSNHHSEGDGSEVESGELSDSNTDQSLYSESYSSCDSDTSEEEIYVDEEQEEQEVAESYPPCIRVIVMESEYLAVGTLHIVTCSGAKIGRENCDICIPDLNISKAHAEIRYNESTRQYEICDLASQNGTFLNSQRLSPAKIASEPVTISHGDHVVINTTKLLCHIHAGYDTCDQCEPGVVIATHRAQQPQTEVKVLSKEERLRQKKLEMNQIKKKYGLKNSAYEDNQEVFNNPNYADKAEERRKNVGSDVPGQKHEAPASVHRPISTGNVGHKMLQKMGWKEGDSLGKNNTGIQEPISVALRASQKAGLGSVCAAPFSADDANTVDVKKASRRIQAQERYKQIESGKSQSDERSLKKQWTQGDTEFT